MKRLIMAATLVAFSLSANAEPTKNTKYKRMLDKIEQLDQKIDRLTNAIGLINNRQIKANQDSQSYAECHDSCNFRWNYDNAPKIYTSPDTWEYDKIFMKKSKECHDSCNKFQTPEIRAASYCGEL